MPKGADKSKEKNNQMSGRGAPWHGPSHPGPAKGKTSRGGKPKGK